MADDVEVTFLGQGTFHGIPAVRRFMAFSAGLLSDMEFLIGPLIVDGDVGARSGTRRPPPATASRGTNHGVDVVRVRDGRIVSLHENNDVRLVREHFPPYEDDAHDAGGPGAGQRARARDAAGAVAAGRGARLRRAVVRRGLLLHRRHLRRRGGARRHRADPDRPRRRVGDGAPPGAAGDGDRDARPDVRGPPAARRRDRGAGLDAPDGRQARLAADRAARDAGVRAPAARRRGGQRRRALLQVRSRAPDPSAAHARPALHGRARRRR